MGETEGPEYTTGGCQYLASAGKLENYCLRLMYVTVLLVAPALPVQPLANLIFPCVEAQGIGSALLFFRQNSKKNVNSSIVQGTACAQLAFLAVFYKTAFYELRTTSRCIIKPFKRN